MRTITVIAPLVLSAASLFCTACNANGESLPEPTYVDERPALSENWVQTDGEPAWVKSPPPKEGTRRFVEVGHSNLRRLAAHGRHPLASKFLTENVRVALEPLIGDEAATATSEDVLAKLVMIHRACKEELTTTRAVPGNTLCTAWALWELPLDASVTTVPTEHRAAARDLLATIDLTVRPAKYQR